MHYLLRTILFPALLLASSGIVLGCSCFQMPNNEEIKNTKMIFSGEVVEIVQDTLYVPPKIKNMPPMLQLILDSRKRYLVKFSIARAFKGTSNTFITLVKYQDDGSCEGMRFEHGKKYLVYANEDDGELAGDGVCSRTQKLDTKSKDHKELSKIFPLKRKGS